MAPFIELHDGLSNDHQTLLGIIAICGSFLSLPEGNIIFVHQPANQFLLKETPNEIFAGCKEAGHHAILSSSLYAMFKTIGRDAFGINYRGLPVKEFITWPSTNPLAAAQYACVYWVDHLQDGWCNKHDDLSLEEGGGVDAFLQQKYLHWLEALSLLGSISQGIAALLKLDGLLRVSSYLSKRYLGD